MTKWFVLFLVLAASGLCLAQSESATLSGRVSDSTGAAILGAEVVLTNTQTNVEQRTKTNGVGLYVFANVHPGAYRVAAGAPGFRVLIKDGLTLHVQDELAENFSLTIGAISESMTVTADATPINTTDASVSTVVDRQFAENLPMNGRSFQTLIQLTPGVVLTNSSYASDGQFSINGQRANSNYWMVDGVSANIGMSSYASASDTLSGSLGGFSAQGGTNSLVSVDAMQEFRIQTSTFAPEFGRTPGGQISIVTRSGGNQFHGTAFDYLRNDVLDANDWFSDNEGLPKAEERQNDFGGTLSGPIWKNRTFFFFSYEGLRLRLPQSGTTEVPDLPARQSPNAAPAVQPFLNAYPLPNGPELLDSSGNPTGAAGFIASYSNRSTLNAASLRIDHKLNDKVALFGRYNYAPSELVARPGPLAGDALSVLSTNGVGTQTATAGLTWTVSSTLTNDLRANYSRVTSTQTYFLDNFGGAKPFDSSAVGLPSAYTSQNSQATFGIYAFAAGWTGLLTAGPSANNLQRQFNLVDSLSWQKGPHSLKFGVDYRHLAPRLAPPSYSQGDYFFSLANAQAGSVDQAQIQGQTPVPLIFRNLSWFGQDTWRATPRLTVTYGLRWDVDFSPKTSSGPSLPAVVNFNDVSTLALAPLGTPVFGTRFRNIAPRVGIAYQFAQKTGWESVVRGGWGLFYDLATSQFHAAPSYYPFGSLNVLSGIPFPLDPSPGGSGAPVPVSSQNPVVFAYDPNIRSPYTQEWNLAFEQSLGPAQSLSASYVGAIGRRLLLGESFYNQNVYQAILTGNYGTSDYDALQVQFQRRLSRGLQALASFSWAHSIDTGSTGAGGITFADYYSREEGAQANRGPSSFDIRHSASVALTYNIPSPRINAFVDTLLQNWSMQNIFQARSAPPVDVNYYYIYSLQTATAGVRPNVTPGVPLYLYGSKYPGGKAINGISGAAGQCPDGSQSIGPFCPPAANTQGDLGRDALRGFGAWQWDFATHRDFSLGEKAKLQFRAELFNVLNHPNFGPPSGNLAIPGLFGLAQQTLAQSLNSFNLGSGGFDPAYQFGGPRALQLALKVTF